MSGDRYFIYNQNDIHFITMTVVEWIDLFTRKELAMVVVDSLNYCIRYKNLEVFAWCIMSNHVHLICRVNSPLRLSDVLRDLKKFTSKEIIRTIIEIPESRKAWLLDKFGFEAKRTGRAKYYKVWKNDNHAVNLNGYIEMGGKVDYIHQNPVVAMIVAKPEDYLWSSAIDYSGGKGVVEIMHWKYGDLIVQSNDVR